MVSEQSYVRNHRRKKREGLPGRTNMIVGLFTWWSKRQEEKIETGLPKMPPRTQPTPNIQDGGFCPERSEG